MSELNGDYLNTALSADTAWYNGTNDQKTGTFNKNYVLKQSSQDMIEEVLWHLGGVQYNGTVTLEDAYTKERGTQGKLCSSVGTCNDKVTRTTTWTGKVGLIYPSDFGYASKNTNCKNNISFDAENCDSNWMSGYGWTISPAPHSSLADLAWAANVARVRNNDTDNTRGVRPTVYLKFSLKIKGEGTISNPYQIIQ